MQSNHTIAPAAIPVPASAKVKIPCELPGAVVSERKLVAFYETNRLLKAVDTWLCLKSLTTSGLIQNMSAQLPGLLSYTQLSRGSFYSRLNLLTRLKLVEWKRKSNQLKLCSWDAFGKHFDISTKYFIEINYNPDEGKKVHQWIAAIEIRQNQQAQRNALLWHIDKNPELKFEITRLMKEAGADEQTLNNDVLFQEALFNLQQQCFQSIDNKEGSEIYQPLMAYRADVNRGVKGFKKAWKFKSAQSASYLKKCLVKSGIADIQKKSVVSAVRSRLKPCWVRWLADIKQTIWFCTDQVDIPAIPQAQSRKIALRYAA